MSDITTLSHLQNRERGRPIRRPWVRAARFSSSPPRGAPRSCPGAPAGLARRVGGAHAGTSCVIGGAVSPPARGPCPRCRPASRGRRSHAADRAVPVEQAGKAGRIEDGRLSDLGAAPGAWSDFELKPGPSGELHLGRQAQETVGPRLSCARNPGHRPDGVPRGPDCTRMPMSPTRRSRNPRSRPRALPQYQPCAPSDGDAPGRRPQPEVPPPSRPELSTTGSPGGDAPPSGPQATRRERVGPAGGRLLDCPPEATR